MGHKNAELLRKLYDAFDKGDLETIQNSMADDSVLHVDGQNPLSGDYKGKEQTLGYLGEFVGLTEGTAKIKVHDILASDEHVVVLSEGSAERKGRKHDWKGIEIFHVRNGQIAEAWFTGFNSSEFDEFLS